MTESRPLESRISPKRIGGSTIFRSPSSPPTETSSSPSSASKKKHTKSKSGGGGGSMIQGHNTKRKKKKKRSPETPKSPSSRCDSPSSLTSSTQDNEDTTSEGGLSDSTPRDAQMSTSALLRLALTDSSAQHRILQTLSDSGKHSPRRRRSLSTGSGDYPSPSAIRVLPASETRKLKREDASWNLRPRDGVCITVSSADSDPDVDIYDDTTSVNASVVRIVSPRKLANSQESQNNFQLNLKRRASTVREGNKSWKALMDDTVDNEKHAISDQVNNNSNTPMSNAGSGTPKQLSAWKRKMHMGNTSLGPLLALVAQSGSDVEADKLFAELLIKEGDAASGSGGMIEDYEEMREELSASMRQRRKSGQKLRKISIIDESFFNSKSNTDTTAHTSTSNTTPTITTTTTLPTTPASVPGPSSEDLGSDTNSAMRKRRNSFRKKEKKEKEKEKRKDLETSKEREGGNGGQSGFRFSLLSNRKHSSMSPTSSSPSIPLSPGSSNVNGYSESAELKALQLKYEDEVARRVRAENELIALKTLLSTSSNNNIPSATAYTSATSQYNSFGGSPSTSAHNLLSLPSLKRTGGSQRGSTIMKGGGRWSASAHLADSFSSIPTNNPYARRTSVVVVVNNPHELAQDVNDDFGLDLESDLDLTTDDGGDGTDDDGDSSYGGIPQLPANEPQMPQFGQKLVMSFSGDLRSVLAPAQYKRIAQMSRSCSTLPLVAEDPQTPYYFESTGCHSNNNNKSGSEDDDHDDFEDELSDECSSADVDLILRESQPAVVVRRRTEPALQVNEQKLANDVEIAYLRRTVEKQKREIEELETVLSRFVGTGS
eukprot:TRINITY_DN3489_c1_g2_i4.p1 TRINITY_DN3489_c1_g2~~TRINITY_DN3489_c1_g2_i4.p1  ORF type:complete len:828 (+),score=209.61 TRINITY_DN3489_c1_g2_i4:66-2549(+)